MTAATGARLQTTRSGDLKSLGVKAAAVIFQGCLVASLAGVAIPARAATTRAEMDTLRIVGVAVSSITGGASDSDESVELKTGIFRFANSASGEALAATDVGKMCFAADDQTVSKTTDGGRRAIAGRVEAVDSDGVWVRVGEAREARRVVLPFFISETDVLAGTSAELVSPVAGAVSSMSVIVQAAVTTGGAVTAKVGTTDIAGLSCTVADAATKGTVVTDTPTLGDATTVVAVGSRIQVVPAAAFATAGAVSGYVEITY